MLPNEETLGPSRIPRVVYILIVYNILNFKIISTLF